MLNMFKCLKDEEREREIEHSTYLEREGKRRKCGERKRVK
jgi:hypothetical protein